MKLVTVKGECIGVVKRRIFFEGMDFVSTVLDCVLEVGFLGVLGGLVVRAILVGGCTIFSRSGRVCFAQDYMCHVLQNFGS